MTPTKWISLALSSMTLAVVAGCMNPMASTVSTPDRGTSFADSTSRSSPPPAPQPQPQPAPPTSMSLPFGMSGSAPTQASLARQVEVAWNSEILMASNTENGNHPMPGLAGRLYVFGEKVGRPLEAPGAVTIVLYAIDKENKVGPPLAKWELDSVALRKLGRTDAIGFGYTIFLPWLEYRPEIRRVQLDVRYVPDGGQPLFAQSSTLALHQDGPPATFTNQLVPVSARK
jgi:hypothetical protein